MSPYLTFPKPLTLETLESHMIPIPGGIFWRGDEKNSLIHKVKVDSFEICRFPVTQILWERIMGKNLSDFKSPQRPVERVSLEDTLDFIKKLCISTQNHFRLPTEIEWVYAAMGGRRQPLKYAGSLNVKEVAYYWDSQGIITSQKISQPTNLKMPNEFGLYDLSGNIWEWCEDRYLNLLYKHPPKFSFAEIEENGDHVIKGGSWDFDPGLSQVEIQYHADPKRRYSSVGFRLARNI